MPVRRRPPEVHTHPPIRCAKCEAVIEACVGLHGDWMHSESRAERCPVGGYARPQTVLDLYRASRAS